jgi:hypothetical protein
MLPDLLAGKSSAPTRLALTSPQQHVRVQIDDRPLGELPLTVELSPGRHEVKAEKANYLPSDRFVDVEGGTTTTLDLPLTLVPNRVDPDALRADAPPAANPAAALAQPTPEVARAGGVPLASWVAWGAAAAAAGAGTFFALSEKGIANRAVDDDGDGVLDLTRAEALTGHRDATLTNVCFAAAGAAALTGLVLWLADDAGSPSSTTAAPRAAQLGVAPLPGGAAARVTLGF